VESLLLQYDSAGELLDKPLYGATDMGALSAIGALASAHDDDQDPMIGRRLGAYRIEREIGRGGMGAVYEAVRADNEFTKRAAIKLVKRGMDTDFILRRFRKERQITGLARPSAHLPVYWMAVQRMMACPIPHGIHRRTAIVQLLRQPSTEHR